MVAWRRVIGAHGGVFGHAHGARGLRIRSLRRFRYNPPTAYIVSVAIGLPVFIAAMLLLTLFVVHALRGGEVGLHVFAIFAFAAIVSSAALFNEEIKLDEESGTITRRRLFIWMPYDRASYPVHTIKHARCERRTERRSYDVVMRVDSIDVTLLKRWRARQASFVAVSLNLAIQRWQARAKPQAV